MKKAIAVLTSFVFMMTLLALPVSAAQEDGPSFGDSILLGDANLDGVISAGDARIALRASVDLEELNELQFLCADFTQDGKVTADDARMILRTSVGLEGDVTPPTEPEDPTVPVEPEPPTEHTHSYVQYACACGEVQDGHFYDFLKEWILTNYTAIENDEYQVDILATYDDGTECAAIYAYEPSSDILAIATVLIAYDYVWVTAFTLPDEAVPFYGYIECLDMETAEVVGSGRFDNVTLSNYVAGASVALTEFDGYSAYQEYYEEMAGCGMTSGLQIIHDHLRAQGGYIFDYAEMGLYNFNAAK